MPEKKAGLIAKETSLEPKKVYKLQHKRFHSWKLPRVIDDVSEFLQIVGNMAFFMAIQVRKPHGMME